MVDTRQVTLAGMADGAMEELFHEALGKVLANIDDPNTDAKAPRSIVMAFRIAPEEDRHAAKVEMSCTTKLAGIRAVNVNVFIGRHEGVLAAVEAPRQEEMFPQPIGRPRAAEGGAA